MADKMKTGVCVPFTTDDLQDVVDALYVALNDADARRRDLDGMHDYRVRLRHHRKADALWRKLSRINAEHDGDRVYSVNVSTWQS
jgi:hypothetical protein